MAATVHKGSTNTSVTFTAVNIPTTIKWFSLVNKTGGVVTVNMGVLYGSTFAIIPYNKSLSTGDAYISNDEILVPANNQITITASGNIDYYVVIE